MATGSLAVPFGLLAVVAVLVQTPIGALALGSAPVGDVLAWALLAVILAVILAGVLVSGALMEWSGRRGVASLVVGTRACCLKRSSPGAGQDAAHADVVG